MWFQGNFPRSGAPFPASPREMFLENYTLGIAGLANVRRHGDEKNDY